MSDDIISDETNINEAVSYNIQAAFTGVPVGNLVLQGSNDPEVLGWTDITETATGVNGDGTYMVNVEFPVYGNVRLTYTRISGSGILNARINAKRR